MAKTIKQIADELGISKQAVFKRIDNLGLRSKLTKIDNQLMVEKEQENMIKSAFSEKQPSTKPSTKPSTSLQLETVNDAVVDVLLNQSEMLKNELKIKNKQIEELNKRLEENQKLLDQQQKLHAMAEQKIQLLEHREPTTTETENTSEQINILKEQLDREKKEQLNQQVKQLKARKSQEERKARTKRLIEIGASVESVLGRPIEKDDLPNLIKFLEDQENRGRWFSKAMNKDSQNYNSNNDEQD